MGKKLLVVSGASAAHSASAQLAARLAEATRAAASADVSVETFHLGQFVYELAEFLEDGVPSSTLASLYEEVRSAQGIIAVSPVFNASYSGVFKLFWDTVEDGDIADTPLLMGATGGSHRHLLMLDHAMQPMFSYLRADVVATSVYATPGDLAAAHERLEARIAKAGAQLASRLDVL